MGYVLSMDGHKLAGCVHGGDGTGYLETNNTLKGGGWFKNHALVKKISENANELMMQEENPWEILCVPSKD